MHEHLRDRILRRLETLSDERAYQVLDYMEFLESRYAQRTAPGENVFRRFADAVENGLRAGKVSATAVAQTMGFMNRAMGVLEGAASAGKSVATDIYNAATKPTPVPPSSPPAHGSSSPASAPGHYAPPSATASSRPVLDRTLPVGPIDPDAKLSVTPAPPPPRPPVASPESNGSRDGAEGA